MRRAIFPMGRSSGAGFGSIRSSTRAASTGSEAARTADDAEQTDEKKQSSLDTMKRTVQFAGVAKREIGLGLLFLPAALSSTLALPFFVGTIIDQVHVQSRV